VNQNPSSRVLFRLWPVLICLGLLSSAGPAAAGPFSFDWSTPLPLGDQTMGATLTMRISPDHLLYADRTKLTGTGGETHVRFPDPQKKPDPFDGQPVSVYPAGEHLVGIRFSLTGPATLTLDYQGCSTQTCYMPTTEHFPVFPGTEAPPPAAPISLPTGTAAIDQSRPDETISHTGAVNTPTGKVDLAKNLREQGLFWTLLLAFLGGILVSFTPCVYPMIPITLSIIGGRKENTGIRRGFFLSVVYVAGLSLTYALLGLVVASFGAQVRGLLYGPVFQTTIAVIFFLLALSMFDVFMLQIPAFLRRGLADVKTTGFGGVFLMGMISGLMASPCIAAPLAGILAFIAASGNAVTGFLLLTAFAWGMGILLILVGTFSGSLNALPKAGEWMERVKEFYGFLLLGAALYFVQPLLGTAVLNLLIGLLLGATSAFLGLFTPLPEPAGLGNKILKAWSIMTLTVACAFALTAAVEWGGLGLPPQSGGGIAKEASGDTLIWLTDPEAARKRARAEGKPLFIDFRADWCVICRRLEEQVFPQPGVAAFLRRMVLLKIDATTNTSETEKLLKTWGVVGLPTLIILDAQGREREDLRVIGDISPENLKKVLEKAQ
jgi:thiol:disulfide interchange protein DsbD